MTMKTLKAGLRALLVADASLKRLLGGTVSDPRIYWYYGGDALISLTLPAYITYALISHTEAAGAVESPIFSLALWAINAETLEDVSTRIETLLSDQNYTIGGEKVHMRRINAADGTQASAQYAGKMLQYRLSWSRV